MVRLKAVWRQRIKATVLPTGTATSGNDYMISDITIPADSTGEYCIHTSISILEDQMVEGDETFNVTLTPSPGLTLDNNVVAITITDNDGKYTPKHD